MMKKGILLVAAIMFLIFSGCTNDGHLSDNTALDMETVKEKLINNTEYVKENIVGTWSASDGTIMEFYSNGIAVNYKPVQITDAEGDDISSNITSELKSIGYSGYVIPDPDSYTDEELQSYGNYIRNTDKVGISIKSDFFGAMEDKFILHEFQDKDTLVMGGLTLTKIKNSEPEVTDDITGLYVNEQDKTLALSVIKIKGEEQGYFEWLKVGGGLDGACKIDADRVVLEIPNITDFVFQHKGIDLIEIGSDEFPGSNLTYKKVSDLAYSSQRDVTPRQDGYLLTTTEFGGYEWYILEQKADKQLLLSKDAVVSLEGETAKISEGEWEDNYIRQYLNNDFYNSFTDSEKAMILLTHNNNEVITTQGISNSTPTDDKVFLLTNEELEKYLSFNDELLCKYKGKSTFWFTRTALQFRDATVLSGINGKGQVYGKDNYESGQYEYGNCVRPAMWVSIE